MKWSYLVDLITANMSFIHDNGFSKIIQSSVLALEESLDVDQVENLIKFCPTKEEMEIIKVSR